MEKIKIVLNIILKSLVVLLIMLPFFFLMDYLNVPVIINFLVLYFGFWFIRNVLKYRNPYRLIMIFGKKGSGKTTLLTKLALKYIKKGVPVYTTSYVPGAYLFNPSEIGMSDFPEDCVIFIDEVGLVWNSRDFKNFGRDVRAYFKYQRHLKHTVYLFSQAFDIDKNLRDLTDSMYIVRCYFNFISVASRVNKKIAVISASESNGVSSQGESRIVDDFVVEPFILALFGSRIFTYIPNYVKYFNSYDPLRFGKLPALTYCEYDPDLFLSRYGHVKRKMKVVRSETRKATARSFSACVSRKVQNGVEKNAVS